MREGRGRRAPDALSGLIPSVGYSESFLSLEGYYVEFHISSLDIKAPFLIITHIHNYDRIDLSYGHNISKWYLRNGIDLELNVNNQTLHILNLLNYQSSLPSKIRFIELRGLG